MKNVLTIANAYGDWVSGINTVVHAYSYELSYRGASVKILARTRTTKHGWTQVGGLPVYYISTPTRRRSWANIPYQGWTYIKKVREAARAFKSLKLSGDVLWLHYGTPDALWAGFQAFPNLRRVTHVHAVWTKDFLEQFEREFAFRALGVLASKPLVFLEKIFLTNSDAIIVYSDWIKNLVEKRAKNVPIHVICNPVDFTLFNSHVEAYPRQKLGLKKNDRVVVYVGKLTPLKGTEYLLETARMLPDYKFLLVGQTISVPEGYYEKKASNNVIFHPRVPHKAVASLMKTGDCYVQPTLRDGVEIPIAEALAVGKPVVITSHEERVGIYEDAVYYAKPANPESLASAILDALRNGPKPCEKVLAKFDIKRNVDALEKVLFIE